MHAGNMARYSLNKREWICSLFKEWILEKSEIRVNLEWTFVLFTPFGVTTAITQGFRVIPEVTPKLVNNTNVHFKFTLISLFSKIHSLKSEHIHSFSFREYIHIVGYLNLYLHRRFTTVSYVQVLLLFNKKMYRIGLAIIPFWHLNELIYKQI